MKSDFGYSLLKIANYQSMIYLFLSIIMSVAILAIFRMLGRLNIPVLPTIVVNYIVCVITGLIFEGNLAFLGSIGLKTDWLPMAVILGVIFIGTFYAMAITTTKFSMSVTSVASKMSLVIPVLFSLLVLGIESKPYNWINYLGIFVALIAIVLSSIKENNGIDRGAKTQIREYTYPLIVFLFGGVIDTSINYANYKWLGPEDESIFPIFLFASASVCGLILLFVKRIKVGRRSLVAGIILGAINYFSIYYIIRSLSAFSNDGALVYPSINIGIIIGATVIGILAFGEKLSLINKVGLSLAVLAIILISYQEIVGTIF